MQPSQKHHRPYIANTEEQLDLERELVRLCIQGNPKAQSDLYLKYSKSMFNVCYRITSDYDGACDVLQNTFIEVFQKLNYFQFESTLGAWIKRIAVNKSIDRVRKNKRLAEDLISDFSDDLPDEQDAESEYNVTGIMEAVNELPEGYKLVFSLYAIEGYDHEEVSQILGISEQTSKSQYHRAKIKLKSLLMEKGLNRYNFEN